jgi:hypothetical protein
MQIIYYVAMDIYLWTDLHMGLPLPLAKEQIAPGCVGFLPVFRDFESAEAWRDEYNPGADIIAVRETVRETEDESASAS